MIFFANWMIKSIHDINSSFETKTTNRRASFTMKKKAIVRFNETCWESITYLATLISSMNTITLDLIFNRVFILRFRRITFFIINNITNIRIVFTRHNNHINSSSFIKNISELNLIDKINSQTISRRREFYQQFLFWNK